MNCINCNQELKENISLKKGFLKLQKVYTYFCVCCDFKKEVIINISKENYNSEVIQMSNTTKTTKMIYDNTKKYLNENKEKKLNKELLLKLR